MRVLVCKPRNPQEITEALLYWHSTLCMSYTLLILEVQLNGSVNCSRMVGFTVLSVLE